MNLFAPGPVADPATYGPYVDRSAGRGAWTIGAPRADDDDWDAKLALLEAEPPAVVSFTFGCPAPDVLARFESWVTVTSPEEARGAVEAGASALVVQGSEAGGHRGSWVDTPDLQPIGLHALLQLIDVDVPLVASGGIASAAAVQAVLALGARAAQVGTAFMRAPEAGTSQAHRDALASDAPTELTRAFSGRLARGLRNRFLEEHRDAPIAYPEIHYVTAPVRAQARQDGDPELINLWAGEAHALAQERPAAEIARALAGQ